MTSDETRYAEPRHTGGIDHFEEYSGHQDYQAPCYRAYEPLVKSLQANQTSQWQGFCE